MKRMPLIVSFLLFVALCASLAYWGLQLWRPPVRPVVAPVTVARTEASLDAAASLFGGRPAAVGVASNYQLKGVVVAGNGRESVAILSADGKPAQAVGVNVEFQPGVSVREVHPQYILLSEGGVIKRVALPDVARAAQAEFNSNPIPGLSMAPTPQPVMIPVPMPQLAPAPSPPPQSPPQLPPQSLPQSAPQTVLPQNLQAPPAPPR